MNDPIHRHRALKRAVVYDLSPTSSSNIVGGNFFMVDQPTSNLHDLQLNPPMGPATEGPKLEELSQEPYEFSFSCTPPGPSAKNNAQNMPFPAPKPNVLSATSPEFIPGSASRQQNDARSRIPQPSPGPGFAQPSPYLNKLKSLIKNMPPPIPFRHPVPSLHQELKAAYGPRGILQSSRSPGAYSAGFSTRAREHNGYGGSGAHSFGYNDPRYQLYAHRSLGVDPVKYQASAARYQNEGYDGSDTHPEWYQTPATAYLNTVYGCSKYGVSGCRSQAPTTPPAGYGGLECPVFSHQSAGHQTNDVPSTGYGGPGHRATGIQSPAYQQAEHGVSSYRSRDSGAYQNTGYPSAGYSGPGPVAAAIARARLHPTSATVPTTPTSIDKPKNLDLLSMYSSGELQLPSDYDYQVEVDQRPTRETRNFLARENPLLPDILISKSKITRNLIRIYESYDVNGNTYHAYGDEFRELNYDFVQDLEQMSQDEKKDFWECNWVEIEVDFRDFYKELGHARETDSDNEEKGKQVIKASPSILHQLSLLGPSLPTYAKTVFVVILLPVAPDDSDSVVSLTAAQATSPQYALLESLVWVLDTFASLQKLEVILRTQGMTDNSPLCLEQINYFLPFFDLEFEDWETKWQASFMSRTEPITAWPLTYLDRERYKVNMARWNEKRAKEVAGLLAERASNGSAAYGRAG